MNKNKLNKKTFKNFKKKQNQIDKTQNKKFKTIFSKLSNLSNNKQKLNFVLPYQPSYDLKNHFNTIKEYIKGLVYPERYLNKGVKLPSAIGTYSFCYGFKEQFDFKPGDDGTFKLVWYPNYFSSTNVTIGGKDIMGGPTTTVGVNRYTAVGCKRFLYSNSNDSTWHFTPCHQYYSATEGYRLVSASIFLRYFGTNINKSGYVMSIPTYREFPAYTALGNLSPSSSGTFTTTALPSFDESVFVNTRGTKTSFTLGKNSVMKRVYVPLDPADSIFEDPGYFYSSAVDSRQSSESFQNWPDALATNRYVVATKDNGDEMHLRVMLPEDGNPIKYLFLGKGFTNSGDTANIHVEAYYNFECIPTEGIRIPNNEEIKKEEEVKEEVKVEALKEVGQQVAEGNVNVNKVINNVIKKVYPLDKDIEIVKVYNNTKQAFNKLKNMSKNMNKVNNYFKPSFRPYRPWFTKTKYV